MSRLGGSKRRIVSPLVYAGVVVSAVVVASAVSMELGTSGALPVPRAAVITATRPQSLVGPRAQPIVALSPTMPPRALSRTVTPPTPSTAAIMPQTISPDRAVVEISTAGSDGAAQTPSTDSSSRRKAVAVVHSPGVKRETKATVTRSADAKTAKAAVTTTSDG
ncbi:MAG: hypothetical protein M0T79_01745 [Actinomycetota bacterium]|nr:hypothetical protein [Actinomycetota bacterium]